MTKMWPKIDDGLQKDNINGMWYYNGWCLHPMVWLAVLWFIIQVTWPLWVPIVIFLVGFALGKWS